MSAPLFPPSAGRACKAIVAIAFLNLAGVLSAEEKTPADFTPQVKAASEIKSAPQRDAKFAEIAAAQAQSGQRNNAFATLGSITDDRVRYQAIAETQRGAASTAAGKPGGAQADFDTLMDLITTTVRPTTWDEVGGPGTIAPFRNGVYVDARGVLTRVLEPKSSKGLVAQRLAALDLKAPPNRNLEAPLRKVSLTRLEKHVQLALAQGKQPSEEMLHLAGLTRIRYVLVYPETGDLVLAGPAGPWRSDDEGRPVNVRSGRPVLQLDDLVVLLRHLTTGSGGTFGCSIEPTDEGLARTKAFAEQSHGKLKAGQRDAWIKKLGEQMGQQAIVVDGIDPHSRVARVIVEADYRMKLVGMGLEPGTHKVPSYLELQATSGEKAAAMSVLRWWFTLKYDAVRATEDRDAFEIVGPGVQVLSENEMLTNLGKRIHTGQSDPMNQEFAARFTQNFGELAQMYPVYADLQNVFDLALVAALIREEQLAERVNWHLTCFNKPKQYVVPLGRAPQSVQSVVGSRSLGTRQFVVGVSGGVHVAPVKYVSAGALKTDKYGALDAAQVGSAPPELPLDAWWWD